MKGMDALASSFGKHQTGCITYILLDRLHYTGNCLNKCLFPLFCCVLFGLLRFAIIVLHLLLFVG